MRTVFTLTDGRVIREAQYRCRWVHCLRDRSGRPCVRGLDWAWAVARSRDLPVVRASWEVVPPVLDLGGAYVPVSALRTVPVPAGWKQAHRQFTRWAETVVPTGIRDGEDVAARMVAMRRRLGISDDQPVAGGRYAD